MKTFMDKTPHIWLQMHEIPARYLSKDQFLLEHKQLALEVEPPLYSKIKAEDKHRAADPLRHQPAQEGLFLIYWRYAYHSCLLK